ncbi:class I SAM-dependent methyltransferase [Anaerosporobacter sp.]
MTNIKWDSKNYASNFSFVHEYGQEVVNLLDVTEGMTVVDLGCGNGQLTKKLSDMGTKAIGVDASEDMLVLARKSYPKLEFINSDATSFTVGENVDAIFSNAVFHWIDNQDDLIANIAKQLKEGGQLVCEFGGYGNTELVQASLEREFQSRGLHYRRNFYFSTIGEYAFKLEKHGLLVKYATLFERPTKQIGEDGLANWIHMFNLLPFQGVEETVQEEIIQSVVEELRPVLYKEGNWYLDYVRIRIKAIK